MVTPILWSIDETARQLGGISGRTVRRMLERGELSAVRIGRCVKINAASVQAYVDGKTDSYNDQARRDVQGGGTCQKVNDKTEFTSGRTRPIGGSVSQTQAASELAAVLKLPIGKKQKHY